MELIHHVDDRDHTHVIPHGEAAQRGQSRRPEDIPRAEEAADAAHAIGQIRGRLDRANILIMLGSCEVFLQLE